ncbi:MAG: tRNA pseudouridine(55) synthase TruB [Candidatus Subteraquimicrobiales bacterium]|nr:tRNA pseudouridine(55) synthase TruB [Candidatus Subteraquimicrobiales bacterium]
MNGILIIDKPDGMTSHDVVLRVRKPFKIKKVGHTGTLDPMATGVLILCLGEATKLTPFLQTETKEYAAQLTLGITTDTLDGEGNVISKTPCFITPNQILKVFKEFKGKIKQIPPLISAIKIRGKPLYKLTRKGTEIKVPEREVEIYKLDLLNIANDLYPRINFNVHCSKGTYVRSLCADIGERLGCGGYLSSLKRTKIGNFSLNQAISLNKIKKMTLEELKNHIIPLNQILSYPSIQVKKEKVKLIRHGLPLTKEMIKTLPPAIKIGKNELLQILDEEKLLAIAKSVTEISGANLKNQLTCLSADTIAKPIRVFNE